MAGDHRNPARLVLTNPNRRKACLVPAGTVPLHVIGSTGVMSWSNLMQIPPADGIGSDASSPDQPEENGDDRHNQEDVDDIANAENKKPQ